MTEYCQVTTVGVASMSCVQTNCSWPRTHKQLQPDREISFSVGILKIKHQLTPVQVQIYPASLITKILPVEAAADRAPPASVTPVRS